MVVDRRRGGGDVGRMMETGLMDGGDVGFCEASY
jgi:hypothetical protein